MPALDDYEEDLRTFKYTHTSKIPVSSEDYTKPNVRHI